MEIRICASPETEIKRCGRRLWIIPGLAVLFQLVPPVLFWAVSTAAYADPPRLSDSVERSASLPILGLSAGASLGLGTLGAYRLLTGARPKTAIALILVSCIPALLGGALYLHALLVFLAWV